MSDLVIVDKDASNVVLRSWCFDLPLKAHDESKEAIEHHTECEAIKKELKDIENAVLLAVNTEKDEDGKLRFGNQTVREAEMYVRLKDNPRYVDYNAKLTAFYTKRDLCKNRASYYERMFSLVKNLLYDALEKERLALAKEMQDNKLKSMVDR